MKSASYNLLWIPNGRGRIIPQEYLENLSLIANQNANHDVRFWIDSQRITSPEMSRLEKAVDESQARNISLQDLREIPEYQNEPLFSRYDYGLTKEKHSLVWQQVDAARILACLQGNYDQSFYSDLDIINLKIDSDEVQEKMKKYGVVLCGLENGRLENGLFGFDKRRTELFQNVYGAVLEKTKKFNENGYSVHIGLLRKALQNELNEIIFIPKWSHTFIEEVLLPNFYL